jgi:phage gp37-like protein
MLGDLENELIAILKDSELGKRLKTVGSLPDVPDKDLIGRWGLEAPAAYVASGDGTVTNAGRVSSSFAVVLVARNARGHEAVRHGDARTIGLYEMLEASLALLHEARSVAAGSTWYATGYQFMQMKELRDRGLHVALLALQTAAPVPVPDISALEGFELLYANWKVVPDAEQDGKPLAEAFIHLNPQDTP